MVKLEKINVILTAVAIVIAFNSTLFISGIDQHFKAIESRIESLTNDIITLRSDLEEIKEQTNKLELNIESLSLDLSIINQHINILNQSLQDINDRIMIIGTIVITYPKNGDKVSRTTFATGTSIGLVGNETLHLYLLVYPIESEIWYVQDLPIMSQDGSWSARVIFGENQDVGKEFCLRAIVTKDKLYTNEQLTESQMPDIIAQCIISNLIRK